MTLMAKAPHLAGMIRQNLGQAMAEQRSTRPDGTNAAP